MISETIRPQQALVTNTVGTMDKDASLTEIKKVASDEAEKLFLENGLREVNGKVVELARRIDMNRSHLQTLLKKHGIQSKNFRTQAVTK